MRHVRPAILLLTASVACARPGTHAPRATAPLGPSGTAATDVPPSLDATLLLIGDAGEPRQSDSTRAERVLRAADLVMRAVSYRGAVVFLGDNVYEYGYPSPGAIAAGRESEARAQRILERQVHLDGDDVPASLPRWILPGNHEWNDRTLFVPRDAAERVAGEGRFIERLAARDSVAMIPSAGCPGPVARDVGRRLRVIAIDTDWWLQNRTTHDVRCGADSTRAAAAAHLERMIGEAGDRRVVVMAHHPLATAGPHGGWEGGAPWRRAWAGVRRGLGYFTGRQDIGNRRNADTRHLIERALRKGHPLAFVAGHEHTLQVFRGGVADWYLVSGVGIYGHTSDVRCRNASTFASSESGFMRLDMTTAGDARLSVITVGASGAPEVRYRRWLTRDDRAPDGDNCTR